MVVEMVTMTKMECESVLKNEDKVTEKALQNLFHGRVRIFEVVHDKKNFISIDTVLDQSSKRTCGMKATMF